jgi:hypothetical protein
MFCTYKDSLGIPGKGVHQHYLGLAMFDILATVILAECIVYFFQTTRIWTLLACFLTGIVLHRLFCVRTTIDKYLFP